MVTGLCGKTSSLLINAIGSEKYLGYAICQSCKRRYLKLSVYKHDRDQSDTTHSSIYSASRQNLCWDYFAFIWTQLVEVVIWQAWYCWRVSHSVTHKHELLIWFMLFYAMMKALLRLAVVRDTKPAGELRGDTVHFITSSSALFFMTQTATSIDH